MAAGYKSGGRQKGTRNKKGSKSERYWHDIVVGKPPSNLVKNTGKEITQQKMTVKEYFIIAFEVIQQDPDLNLLAFARQNLSGFYSLMQKCIPAEVAAHITQDINITWNEELTFETSKPVDIDDKDYIEFKENE